MSSSQQKRKLRYGMIGGGPGSFIGAVHRKAAALDGLCELVAGCFSSDPGKSKQTGNELHLDPSSVYGSIEEMIEKESQKNIDERPDFISIVTPNHLHYRPAALAIEKGFHVIIDKPMTFDLDEAFALAELVNRKNPVFCLTHTYTGYPMIKEARHLVSSGVIGNIRRVVVQYPQGWLSNDLERTGNKQAEWRTDPSRSGKAGAVGDIGTHAFNLAEYITGLKVIKLCADVNTFVEGRKLDDDASVLLKFENDAAGVLVATQVAAGEENNLNISISGEKGTLTWEHRSANTLVLKKPGAPEQVLRAGSSYLSEAARMNSRTPAGHPEGYIEAFANLYRNFALAIYSRIDKKQTEPWIDFPGINEGVRGMQFIEAVIMSGESDEKWISLETAILNRVTE